MSDGASSLLFKYTTISNSIATTRQAISKKESRISSLQDSIGSLRSHHDSMQRELDSAIAESNNLSQSISRASRAEKEYQKLIRGETAMSQKIDLIRGQMDNLKKARKVSRREFWQSCREFRIAVRRARVSLEGFSDDDDTLDTGSYSRKGLAEDEEMKEARLQKETSLHLLQESRKVYGKSEQEKRKLERGARERVENLQQQRNQLERVRMDVQNMERDLAQLEQETKECEQISDGFQKDASRRRETQTNGTRHVSSKPSHWEHGLNCSVTPSPENARKRNSHRWNASSNYCPATNGTSNSSIGSTRRVMCNPYKRKIPSNGNNNSSADDAESAHDAMPRHETGSTNGDHPSASCASTFKQQLRTQHPHRAGRIRVDRQFTSGVSLGIFSEDDADHVLVDEKDGNDNSGDVNNDIRNGHSIHKDDDLISKGTTSCSSSSDDDDDDVLMFIPFRVEE